MMGELKKMRTEKKMTQQQVADLVLSLIHI